MFLRFSILKIELLYLLAKILLLIYQNFKKKLNQEDLWILVLLKNEVLRRYFEFRSPHTLFTSKNFLNDTFRISLT